MDSAPGQHESRMPEPSASSPVAASAPGKLVLCGEYAVLDGAPAICMAVDRRARVTIDRAAGDHHVVSAPGFSSVTGRFTDRNGDCEWVSGAQEYRLVNDVWRTAQMQCNTPLSIKLDTNEFLDPRSGAKFGIGSSAALTVALVAGLCKVVATTVDATSIAFAAHRHFQGGLGSGADIACCSAGGLIEYRLRAGPAEQLAWPDGLAYAFLWSGMSTGTKAKLEQLGKYDRRPTRAALAESAMRMSQAWRDGTAKAILDEYRDYTRVLREFSVDHELGIFDAGHGELTASADAAGLVYKPCGAGGGDVGVVLAEDPAAIRAFVDTGLPANFRAMDMGIDLCGVRVAREEL